MNEEKLVDLFNSYIYNKPYDTDKKALTELKQKVSDEAYRLCEEYFLAGQVRAEEEAFKAGYEAALKGEEE